MGSRSNKKSIARKRIKRKTIIGDDGDKEWLCKHGIGHGENVHTCDGCCIKEKYDDK